MINPLHIARTLADVLEANEIDYAIGGALALGFYAEPRATMDVDINIFVSSARVTEVVLNVLSGIGFKPDDPARFQETAQTDGQFRGRIDGVRVDVFVPAIDYYASLAARRRTVMLNDRSLQILGPEDLLVLKMMFFRRKDLADAEAVLRSTERFDCEFVRRHLVEFVGDDDPRIEEWDQLVSETRG